MGLQNAISYILDLSSASDLDSLKRLYLNPPDLRVIDEEDMLPDSSLISSDEQISDLMAKSSLQKSTHQAKSPSSEAISQSSEALVVFVGGAVQLEGTEHGEVILKWAICGLFFFILPFQYSWYAIMLFMIIADDCESN